MLLFSECVRNCSGEELAGLNAVVSDHADHLVELWTHLDAAGETTVRRVGCVVSEESRLLERQSLVALLVPRVRDHYTALSAGNSRCEEVYWHLIWLELLVTSTAFGEYPWDAVALNQIEKRLT
jgi:hypothetical protein